MNWPGLLSECLEHIEENLQEEIDLKNLCSRYGCHPLYLQKGFSMLTGIALSEYIRNRRLSQAGLDLLEGKEKILTVALRYGYENASSFSKAFLRFHGISPLQARSGKQPLRHYLPLHIQLSLQGGEHMDYRLETKPAFTVAGKKKELSYENLGAITDFWAELHQDPEHPVMGWYGINYDTDQDNGTFQYLIADPIEFVQKKEGLEIKEIPELTWAIFEVKGFTQAKISQILHDIFSQFLPSSRYRIADDYLIEMYPDPSPYPLGVQDPEYPIELWVPVEKE